MRLRELGLERVALAPERVALGLERGDAGILDERRGRLRLGELGLERIALGLELGHAGIVNCRSRLRRLRQTLLELGVRLLPRLQSLLMLLERRAEHRRLVMPRRLGHDNGRAGLVRVLARPAGREAVFGLQQAAVLGGERLRNGRGRGEARATMISPSGRPVTFCSVSATSSCSSVIWPRLASREPRGSARIRGPPLSGSAATPSPFLCRRTLSASVKKRDICVPPKGHAKYGVGMT